MTTELEKARRLVRILECAEEGHLPYGSFITAEDSATPVALYCDCGDVVWMPRTNLQSGTVSEVKEVTPHNRPYDYCR